MAKLRKWCAYRKIERPYTRYSQIRGKAFIKAKPGKKVVSFVMGDPNKGVKGFSCRLQLISKDLAQIRANAIEAGRVVALRHLEAALGVNGFFMQICIVPHHIIRENPLAAGAGADRLSTGMSHAFGKVIGTAARVEPGKVVIDLGLPKEFEALGRKALAGLSQKLPIKTTVQFG
jgi:large subunit ribosomal protein L10e